jgi:hypothetical protein
MKAMFWTVSLMAGALFGFSGALNHLATLF